MVEVEKWRAVVPPDPGQADAAQVAGKSRMVPAEPVGAVVARGEAEIGFERVGELKPIAGIDLVGTAVTRASEDHNFLCGHRSWRQGS